LLLAAACVALAAGCLLPRYTISDGPDGGGSTGGSGGLTATGAGGGAGAGGAGGTSASGGAGGAGAGGSSGSGGAGGSSAACQLPANIVMGWYFATNAEGFGGADFLDNGDGCPAPGVLRASVTFTAGVQGAHIDLTVSPRDLRGTTLYAKVKLVSGFSPGTRIFVVNEPGDMYADAGPVFPSVSDGWVSISLDPESPIFPTGFVPDNVTDLGVALDAVGNTGTVVMLIDSVLYTRP
jgi:hypothetical protein